MSTPSTASWDSIVDAKTPTLVFFGNDFPNDDTGHLYRVLHQRSAHMKCHELAHFITLCNQVIREEIARLPKSWQDQVPDFDDVLTLVDDSAFRKGPLGGAMEGVFLIILQLGLVIGHHEVQQVSYQISHDDNVLAGLGVGLLSAAAVSFSSTLSDLAKAGAESVRTAFRLGVHVYEISEQLEAPDTQESPWAFVIPGLTSETVQTELDTFNQETSNPALTQIFISAWDASSVTVSGPPTRLRACLKSSDVLRYSNFFPLPVHHGLCHASHIYTDADVRTIMDGVFADTLSLTRQTKTHCPLLSSGTGEAYQASDLSHLLGQIVEELLMNRMHIDNVAVSIATILEPRSSDQQQQLPLWTFRSSMVLKAILRTVSQRWEGRGTFQPHDFVDWIKETSSNQEVPRSTKQSKLAVVGMSCRLPGGANDLEMFWKLMLEKRDVHTEIPADRFDLESHYDPSGQKENTTQTPFMNPMDNPGLFDAGFFNISPKEAEQMDPMHRLALVTAYEALEMSGYAPNRTPSTSSPRVGTYYGQASDDWRELNASQNIGTYAVPSGERGFANGRINYFFKFSGPSFNMDTACSSGLAAVNAACSALWAGEASTAIAGGLNVITDPDNFCQLGKGHFLSTTGQCKVWDEAADGYCRADGVGSIVIKRLEDALADNDKILATILGANTNHSAEAISITHPHAPSQANNYRKVMAQAGVSPLDVSYVELHGTGTQAGDREEARSVSDVFAPVSPRRKKNQRLRLGALKANIGHGEAAAGIASFIKVLLMYQKNVIPPQIGVKKLNPTLPSDMEERNMGLNWEYCEWQPSKTGSRNAIVNSFGAHGGNTTVLLSDAPLRVTDGIDPRSVYPLVISARSKNSLKKNTEALLQYLETHPETKIGDLSYTLTARRIHHPFRLAKQVTDISEAKRFLSNQLDKMQQSQWVASIPLKAPTVAFVFTGQGAFYLGMGAQLYAHCASFRADVQHLDRLIQSLDVEVESIVPIIQGSDGQSNQVSPVASQLAIVLIQIALTHYWQSLGVKPSMVMGHSLGEFAALATAGVISELDALYLVAKRAKLMMTECQIDSHSMLAVRCGLERLEQLLSGHEEEYELACINGENDLVISGTKQHISTLATLLSESDVKSTLLKVPFAFHSAQMDPLLEPFAQVAKHIAYKAPQIPVISPLLAECIFDGKTINHGYLQRATRECVDVVGALDAAQELGLADADTVWIDIGPHMVAGSMVRNIMSPTTVVASLKRDEDDYASIVSSLTALHCAGVAVSWNEYFRQYERCHELLHLPTYRWNEKLYWIPYLGTWTLDKANIKHNLEKAANNPSSLIGNLSSKLKTSTIHGILSQTVDDSSVRLTTISNLLDPSFLEAVEGHRMNNYGIASSSIWADMAFVVGEYMHKLGYPGEKKCSMNVIDMEILHAQVAGSPKDGLQLIQLEATLDITSRIIEVFLYNVSNDNSRAVDHYGSFKVQFQDASPWTKEWRRVERLVNQRIETLDRLATEGVVASRLTRNMAYTLFKNVVDYADHYRGMESVVIHDYEAFADVTLHVDEHGVWHTPPHWIDSLCHLGGLVMNGSDASNTADFFYVTPGWDSFRLAQSPRAGAKYRSYVHMEPTVEDPKMWAGDVYILQDGTIVGMMGQMKFRQVNRVLMDRFFSPSISHDSPAQSEKSEKKPKAVTVNTVPQVVHSAGPVEVALPQKMKPSKDQGRPAMAAPEAAASSTAAKAEEDPLLTSAVGVIANETGIDAAELVNDTTFSQIGVDSLMSLVLVEKFKAQLKMEVKSSLFIECETIGQFKEWLEENR
ncbi:polyketide synthase [Aureobasidium sp. EXF-10728]|nr:polyketide synthase [Aureobasidium sp. EXF-10728]